MLSRIRASISGEPLPSPEKSPRPQPSPPNDQTPPRPGFGGFFSQSSNGSENRLAAPQSQEQPSFFGGLFPPSSQRNVEEDSPGTIRASAAALLKMATPPPFNESNNSHQHFHPHSPDEGIDDVDQRGTLEYQINRRDAYISKLQSDLHKMQTQLGQYQKDNNTLRRQQLESTHRHSIAIKLWRRTNDGLGARVECFENETTPTAAREIANLIRDAAPPNKDSAYLMMLQDQLTKATAKLDHLGSQTEIVLHKGEEVVESLREEMNEVIRERCRMELELLDQERMLEDDMRRMVLKTERRLKRVQGEIDFLEKNAVECLKNQEEDEADDDDDGEDENKKEGISEDEKENGDEDISDDKGDDEKQNGEEGDGDDGSSGSGSCEDMCDEQEKKSSEETNPKEASENDKKVTKKEQQQPEILRKELRKIAMERDRSLSVLQKKLREKNEEFHGLMRLREGKLKSVHKLEEEKRDREEWERSRQDILLP
ncbi:hypothetical protein ACHAXR_011411 [Thalassiosira sp. AJA248-18]